LQHLVVVIEENHGYGDIAGNPSAPYINSLMRQGASLASMYAITHPSEPNYVALFSGSTHGLTGDSCPVSFAGPNLATQLLRAGRSFAGYSEGLPRTGYPGCSYGAYVRRHAPWNSFPSVPRSLDKPLTALPGDYAKLPRVSFVIPNLDHDMHDGTIAQADTWLRSHFSRYVAWARSHDSALMVTWDEDDFTAVNKIPTVIVGASVRHMRLGRHADLYRLVRTIEWLFGLPALGHAASRAPITAIWSS
jgi:acid phosphatase